MNSGHPFYFYRHKNDRSEIFNYFSSLDKKVRAKIITYVVRLVASNYKLGMPYCRHIEDKIWELRVDFDKNFYRIFYFAFTKDAVLLLHGFSKKTNKTPRQEIERAQYNYQQFLIYRTYTTYEKTE